ncbi:aspartate aminotransferase family protein [Hominisplanchenecus murintestinalis]|uniref:aspartate aminotransferase family protein n=1 Tax=Hominisplanchenecus murintestinalis TaxID=2941517 RepID=UPI002041F219|nr:acetylornithine/succinylornithine family transaminase [Hominisplanchenecus murintestinalis]
MNPYIKQANQQFVPVYNRYPIVWDHGEGMYLYDTEGKRYLDFGSGIGVCALGYHDQNYTRTLQEQMEKLLHTSNLFYNVPAIEAAKLFNQASGMEQVFFTNSGTEAIEGAVKIAKKYHFLKHNNHNGEIIAMKKSFHGRSMGALSITGKATYQEPFAPMLAHVKFADFNDLDSVKRLITKNTCAIFMETVQGESGIYPTTEYFIKGVRKLCDENKILMVLDEIQCGMGRSGNMFAYQLYDVAPDIVVSAKALGCGIPVGAIGTRGAATGVLCVGDHGTTYGSNPLAAAAVTAVFQLYQQYNILANVRAMTTYLDKALSELAAQKVVIKEVRGLGLMKGIELSVPAAYYINALQEAGIIVIPSGSHVIRLLPPLILEKEHIDALLYVLKKIL